MSMLRADGTRIVDDAGKALILKGCNVGNWLLLEMWMLNQSDIDDQYAFENILTDRFGEIEKKRLMDIYRENYITEKDFQIIKSFGFNVVRVPFHYSLLLDDSEPSTLRPDAFKWLDKAVLMAEKAGLYVILDLHGAPGGQSVDHTTGRGGVNLLWSVEKYKNQCESIWKSIAERYRHVSHVAAYDLLNEPFGDYRTDKHVDSLVSVVKRLYRAIRAVDKDHLIIIPGAQQGIGMYGAPEDHAWENVLYTEHYYPGLHGRKPTLESHARFITQQLPEKEKYLKKIQAPFLVGEFNVALGRLGAPHLMRRYFDDYGARGWAATMWSYKLVNCSGGVGDDSWYMVKNKYPVHIIDIRTATIQEIEDFFKSLATMQYAVHEELREALLSTDPSRLALAMYPPLLTVPPAEDHLDEWLAVDVGGSLKGGQKCLPDGGIEIYGSGADIWNDSDQFRFVYRDVGGDFTLSARIDGLVETEPFAKGGLMLRRTLLPDSAHFLLHVFPNGRVVVGWRETDGATMKEKRVGIGEFPIWLRLSRSRGAITASYSNDGEQWLAAMTREGAWFNAFCKVGMAVLSHDVNRSLTTARFQCVSFNGSGEGARGVVPFKGSGGRELLRLGRGDTGDGTGFFRDVEGVRKGGRYRFRLMANVDRAGVSSADEGVVELRLESMVNGKPVTLNYETCNLENIATGDNWSPLSVSGTVANDTLRVLVTVSPAAGGLRGTVNIDNATVLVDSLPEEE